jgi:hypothetical protein
MKKFTHSRSISLLCAVSLTSLALVPTLAAAQQPAASDATERTAAKSRQQRPDLADSVIGTYTGDVISDSRGSSQPGVTLYVTKVNKSTVRVASDYARLPTVDVPIGVYSNQVLATRGAAVFVLNRNKSPHTLDFNPDSTVSFAGVRQQ